MEPEFAWRAAYGQSDAGDRVIEERAALNPAKACDVEAIAAALPAATNSRRSMVLRLSESALSRPIAF